jgi:ketosteroid isomerase-like protein
MTTDHEKIEIAKQFLAGLRGADRNSLAAVVTEETVWSLPGESLISGEAKGLDAIHRRTQAIADYGMNFELKHLLIGRHGVAASLHNTAQHGGMIFDMYLATVMTIRDGKVVALDTYMADIAMLNRFFAPR